jgi:uncharacterized protein
MTFRSAIYEGHVVHKRFAPKEHALNYRVFSLLVDLDELAALSAQLRLFGFDKGALFSVFTKDHGNLKGGESLKDWALAHLHEAGFVTEGMRIEMLCYPRILGYTFNPLTVYFCYAASGRLEAILYEVCNTFHERHTYIIPAPEGEGPVRHSCAKTFYVSPFMPMDCEYHFDIQQPGDKTAIRITETGPEGKMLYASFAGARKAMTDRNLAGAFLKYPLMTLKVTAAIHFEAVRLWFKGLKLYRHSPAEKVVASSLVRAAKPGE